MQNFNNKSLSGNLKFLKKQQKKIYKQGSIWFQNLLEKKRKKNYSLSLKTDKVFFENKIAEIKKNPKENITNIKFFITKEYEIRPRISTEISLKNQKYIKQLVNFIRQYKWSWL